jgi:hypothetical protein
LQTSRPRTWELGMNMVASKEPVFRSFDRFTLPLRRIAAGFRARRVRSNAIRTTLSLEQTDL